MLGVATAVNGRLRGELAGIPPEPGSQAYRQGAKGKDLNAMDRGADLFVLFLYFSFPRVAHVLFFPYIWLTMKFTWIVLVLILTCITPAQAF